MSPAESLCQATRHSLERRTFSSPRISAGSAIACGSEKPSCCCNCWSNGSPEENFRIASISPEAIESEFRLLNVALGRRVTFARVNLVLQLLAFLVRNRKRIAVWGDQVDFHFPEFSVAPPVGRAVA